MCRGMYGGPREGAYVLRPGRIRGIASLMGFELVRDQQRGMNLCMPILVGCMKLDSIRY